MAAFGATGEYATLEADPIVVLAASDTLFVALPEEARLATGISIVVSELLAVIVAEKGRAFDPATIGQGELITIAREDRTIVVPPDTALRSFRPSTISV